MLTKKLHERFYFVNFLATFWNWKLGTFYMYILALIFLEVMYNTFEIYILISSKVASLFLFAKSILFSNIYHS